jgi:hypothetical protein
MHLAEEEFERTVKLDDEEGVSTRKVAGTTGTLSKGRVGRDAVSRVAARLEEQRNWRKRFLIFFQQSRTCVTIGKVASTSVSCLASTSSEPSVSRRLPS